MANLNKVMLIGRLTRDPESRTFTNGGKVTTFGFAVTGQRRKNQQSGQWEDEPCFVDVKAFNRGEPNSFGRKLADLCEQYLHKGDQAFLEGHLVMEKWQDKTTNENRTKLVVYLDDVQFLQPKRDGMAPAPRQASVPARQSAPSYSEDNYDGGPAEEAPVGGPPEGDIPF
jgi:single-strand DNA-binding protein